MLEKFEKNSAMAQDWKRSVFIPIPKKDNAKESSNYTSVSLISQARKVMQKFSKPCFSNTWTVNFQMFKLVFKMSEEPEIKWPTSTGSSVKQESSRKRSTSALLTIPKTLTVCITINVGKFWKGWEYQSSCPASWDGSLQVRKHQFGRDMEKLFPHRKWSTSRPYIVTLLI